MEHVPTAHELARLADDIARDGVTAHADRLAQLGAVADCAGLHAAPAAVLQDVHAPALLQARAFMAICRNWEEIRAAVQERIDFQRSFDALLTQWSAHQDLRKTGDMHRLWLSRLELERLRARTARGAIPC